MPDFDIIIVPGYSNAPTFAYNGDTVPVLMQPGGMIEIQLGTATPSGCEVVAQMSSTLGTGLASFGPSNINNGTDNFGSWALICVTAPTVPGTYLCSVLFTITGGISVLNYAYVICFALTFSGPPALSGGGGGGSGSLPPSSVGNPAVSTWLPPWLIDLQVAVAQRAVTSTALSGVPGYTVGEDLECAVLLSLGGSYLISEVTALELVIRPTGNKEFDGQALIKEAPEVALTAVPFPIVVATSSSSSTAVTLAAAAPSNLIPGCTLLGQIVSVVSGTDVTLATNASTTISEATTVNFTNPQQQYYAINFILDSEKVDDWFSAANDNPANANTAVTPQKIPAVGFLQFTWNDLEFVTQPFLFNVLQNPATPAPY